LQQYYTILNPEVRMTMVTCLKIFRGKDLVAPSVIMPVLFKLFKCKDKELRKFLHNGLICDLKRLNLVNKSNGINKKMQNFIFEMLQDPNETASKRALSVMIELYKRKIWNDDKTVNVIAEGCLHDNPKVVAAATKFFLILDYDWESDSDGDVDASDEEMEQKMIQGKYKGTKKMTKARIHKVDKVIKQHKRKEKRKNKIKFSTDFLPIDLIYDPQAFAEKVFNKLRKSTERYEVKLLMMRLISRMIGRHQLFIQPFYPHILRYLQSHEKDKIGEIFAMIIESCHELVPPEEIKPIIEKIISNFITEYCANQHITIGLNAIRELLLRMPLALDESQIEYLVAFRSFRNSSVVNAAKSLINYFRDVCPHLLPKKFRGRFTKLDDDNRKEEVMVYGRQRINYNIDGIELLQKAEGLAEG
jgi:protein SDA1